MAVETNVNHLDTVKHPAKQGSSGMTRGLSTKICEVAKSETFVVMPHVCTRLTPEFTKWLCLVIAKMC